MKAWAGLHLRLVLQNGKLFYDSRVEDESLSAPRFRRKAQRLAYRGYRYVVTRTSTHARLTFSSVLWSFLTENNVGHSRAERASSGRFWARCDVVLFVLPSLFSDNAVLV
jgi:hypothetical protein